jgi:hypothetical protein
MSITSAKSGATGISLALENNFMEPIASTVVGSGGSNVIIFNDIPQTYKHLQVRLLANSTANADVFFQLNGDTGANYTRHYVYGSGSSAAAGASTGMVSGSLGYVALTSNTNMFGVAVFDLLDYTNANKNKTTRSLTGYDANGSGLIVFYSSLWQSTAAVTSISIFTNPQSTSNFGQYTRASLYGIKG